MEKKRIFLLPQAFESRITDSKIRQAIQMDINIEELTKKQGFKTENELVREVLKTIGLFNKMNYEAYGGAALLGVNGITIVSHGRSSFKAIANAILVAQKNAKEEINKTISEKLKICR